MDDGGVNATYCGNDGNWTRDKSEILKCEGISFFFLMNSYFIG